MMQEDLPEFYFENTFKNNVFSVWLAPPEGLYLNRVSFLFILIIFLNIL